MPMYVVHLRQWRDRFALTQEQLAERAGINRATVARAEAGLAIRRTSYQRLARALGVGGKPWRLQGPPP